jgi:hypothetical protein
MKRIISILIISFLWILTIYSLIVTTRTEYELNTSNYIAYALLLILTFLKVVNVKKLNTILGVILLLGMLNLISFTYKTYSISFGITIAEIRLNTIGLQPLSLVLLLVLILFDVDGARNILKKIFPETKPDNFKDKDNLKKSFREKYKGLTQIELETIVKNESSYQKEAILAAKDLLEELKLNN